jgi:hypothetical protein
VLKGIFRPGRGEGTGGWRRLYNEKLHNLYSSPNKQYEGNQIENVTDWTCSKKILDKKLMQN